MKLTDIRPNIETSGNLEEQLFSIEDTGMIFDILRNKMYSDPIRAICREISSNARDAHREVGKESVPCEITLPNTFERFYKIKDFGPGISPERMANVFIKYTGSTKRHDNTQTGGFGLGAKTPFSYNDEFAINTVHNNIKFSYSCFIDETKMGKLICMNTVPTDEENGTEIVIPVKPQDFQKFINDTEFVTRHWDVRPIIKGTSLNYTNIAPTLKGNNYAICKSTNTNILRDVKLIVDGIEYPLDINQLKGFTSTKVLDAINGTVYLYFGVGDLSLSATREAVHLDKSTQAKIASRLQEIIKDLTNDVLKQIDTQPSLWDANIWINNHLQKTFSSIDFLGKLFWKGITLTKGRLLINNATVHIFTKGKHSRGNYNPTKIHKSIGVNIDFIENASIYLCDLELKELQVKNVSKAFADNPTLKYIYVVKANESHKIEDIDKNHMLTQLGAQKISNITKASKNYNISGVRLLVFKFSQSFRSFKQVSYSLMEEDTNKKIICSLSRNDYKGTRSITLKNKKYLTNDIVESLLTSNSGYSIYGVDDAIPNNKVEEHFSDFQSIDDFIEEKIFKNSKLDLMQIKYAIKNQWNLDRHLDKLDTYTTRIVDKNSDYIKYVCLNLKLKELSHTYVGMLNIYEQVKGQILDSEVDDYIKKNPDLNLKKQIDFIQKTYPLLEFLDHYNSSRASDPIIHYINLIDKEKI